MEEEARRLEEASEGLLEHVDDFRKNMNKVFARRALQHADVINNIADMLMEDRWADDKEAVLDVLREAFR